MEQPTRDQMEEELHKLLDRQNDLRSEFYKSQDKTLLPLIHEHTEWIEAIERKINDHKEVKEKVSLRADSQDEESP